MRKSLGRAPEHPARIWEAHRLLFTKLYRDDKRKLEDVRRILNEEYKFYATARQYKRKIKDWHLEKNSKAADKQHAPDKLESLNIDLDARFTYKSEEKDIASHKIRRFAMSQGTRQQGSNENPREFSLSGIIGNQSIAAYKSIRYGTVRNHCLGFPLQNCEKLESLASVQCDQVTLSIPIRAFLQWGNAVLRALSFGITPISLLMLYIHRLELMHSKQGKCTRVCLLVDVIYDRDLEESTVTGRTTSALFWEHFEHIDNEDILTDSNNKLDICSRDGTIGTLMILSRVHTKKNEDNPATFAPYDSRATYHALRIYFEQIGGAHKFIRHSPMEIVEGNKPGHVLPFDQRVRSLAIQATGSYLDMDSELALSTQDSITYTIPGRRNDCNTYTGAMHDYDLRTIDFLNGMCNIREDVSADAAATSLRNSPIQGVSTQNSKNVKALEIKIDTCESWQLSPPISLSFPSALLDSPMQMTMPTFALGDAFFEDTPLEMNQDHESDLPDLYLYLDSSLWSDCFETTQRMEIQLCFQIIPP